MNRLLITLALLPLLISTSLFDAHALSITVHGEDTVKDKFLFGASTLSEEDGLSSIPATFVSGSIPGIGRFRAVFNQAQVISPTLTTLRGMITTKKGTQPLSASLFKSINTLSLFFNDQSRALRHRKQFALEVRIPLTFENEHYPTQVLRSPLSRLSGGCEDFGDSTSNVEEEPATPDELDTSGDEAAKGIKTHILGNKAQRKQPKKMIQMSVVVDPSALRSIAGLGISTNDYVQSIVNSANTILSRQFNYLIKVTLVTPLQTDFSTATASETLIKEFSEYQTNGRFFGDVDLYHLFTSRDLDSNTIGIAYRGALCNNAFLRFSLTQMIPFALQHLVFVHEIGHNMGATHDKKSDKTIMAPGLSFSAPPKAFSKRSISEIQNYLSNGHAQCTKSLAPNPLPIVIGERKKSPDTPGSFKASFYLSTNAGESTAPYPMSVFGRRIARGAQFEHLYTSQAAVYGLNFSPQNLAQYKASVTDGKRTSRSAILTIPSSSARLSLSEDGAQLKGALSGVKEVFPTKIEIIDRSNRRSSKVLKVVTTDQSGAFSTPRPRGAKKIAARWFYTDSQEAVVSKVID